MIYEWKCPTCGDLTEVIHSVAEHDVPPDYPCKNSCDENWVRKISTPNYDMEHMRDKGILERLEKFT